MNTSLKTETAIFAAGCFWGVEESFRVLDGVLSTEVGYCGGHTENPTYEDVCNKDTGHAESVKIEFNPSVISYQKLLDVFWSIHDPTTLNRQGPDVGSQYRSVIFFASPEQQKLAEQSRDQLQNSKKYLQKVVTEIIPAQIFYKAEEYHQKYLAKSGLSVCH